MNRCGVEANIAHRFLAPDESVEDVVREYDFTNWFSILYDAMREDVYIPRSIVAITDEEIDRAIATMPNRECFARLDAGSAKPEAPYTSAREIRAAFARCERLQPYLHQPVIVREYLHGLRDEFRCFVHDGTFRAISTPVPISPAIRAYLVKCINTITHYTDYRDYTADFAWGCAPCNPCVETNAENRADAAISPTNEITSSAIDACSRVSRASVDACDSRASWAGVRGGAAPCVLIELNSPVWLCATSGFFNLDEGFDAEVLCGDYHPDILDYPVVRVGQYSE